MPDHYDYFDFKEDGGCKADGITDDTEAIQEGLDRLRDGTAGSGQSAGGTRRGYFPPGHWITTAPLVMDGHQGTELYGAGYSTRLSWKGAISTQEILKVVGSRECNIHSMRMGPFSSDYGLNYVIHQIQDGPLPGSGTSSLNRYRHLQIEGLEGPLAGGIFIDSANPAVDANNDATVIEDVYIDGYTAFAVQFNGANSLANKIKDCYFMGQRGGAYGVIVDGPSNAAHVKIDNLICNGHTSADIHIAKRCGMPISIDGFWSEGSEAFITTGGPSAAVAMINVKNAKWASDLKETNVPVMKLRVAGPISFEHVEIGSDYAKELTVEWDYVTPGSAPFLSMRGVVIVGAFDTLVDIFPIEVPSEKVHLVAQTGDTDFTVL